MIIQETKKSFPFQQTVYFPKKSRLHDFVNNIVLNKLSEDSFITMQCTASRCDLLSYETKKSLRSQEIILTTRNITSQLGKMDNPKMIQMRKPSFTRTIIPNFHKISGMRIDSQKRKVLVGIISLRKFIFQESVFPTPQILSFNMLPQHFVFSMLYLKRVLCHISNYLIPQIELNKRPILIPRFI